METTESVNTMNRLTHELIKKAIEGSIKSTNEATSHPLNKLMTA